MAVKKEKTEVVAEVLPEEVPFKNTTVGKTVRTFFQATSGVLLTVIPLIASNDDIRNFLASNPKWSWLLLVFPVATAVMTAIQNGIDPNVKLY